MHIRHGGLASVWSLLLWLVSEAGRCYCRTVARRPQCALWAPRPTSYRVRQSLNRSAGIGLAT